MFELHPRLASDTIFLADWPLCRILLMNDSQYPWLILVPRVAGIREIYELSPGQQVQLIHESSAVGKLLTKTFHAEKINVAALGNQVPQLHLHQIARFSDDPAWPNPIWGAKAARPYSPEAFEARKHMLEHALEAALRSDLPASSWSHDARLSDK